MVNAHQGYKLPTALDEVWLDLVFTRMVFERKGVEEVDPFVPRNFRMASSMEVSPNTLPSKSM